jgi:hypothetical protein
VTLSFIGFFGRLCGGKTQTCVSVRSDRAAGGGTHIDILGFLWYVHPLAGWMRRPVIREMRWLETTNSTTEWSAHSHDVTIASGFSACGTVCGKPSCTKRVRARERKKMDAFDRRGGWGGTRARAQPRARWDLHGRDLEVFPRPS